MNLFVILIVFACLASKAFAQLQHNIQRRQASQYCITPENYYGSCVTLSYCPQVVNVFQTQPQNVAQRYVIALQRGCGTRSVNGDPVVCCTRPAQRPVQTQRHTTQAPRNPFFPTAATSPPPTTPRGTRNPENPFLNPQTSPATTTSTTSTTPDTTGALIDNRATYCRGPDTREGSCIAIEQCKELVNELLVKQQDETFANFLRASNSICGGAGSTVCCPSAGSSGRGPAPSPKPTRLPFTTEIPRRLPTPEEGCGYTTNSFKKIVGGEVSKKGAWPWTALIGYDDDLSSSPFKCGGTLITARHVVTAAHCIRNDLAFVRLGEHDLSTDTEAKHVDIRVVRKETHPNYNKRNGRSDIALLYLERNVEFNDFISAICLPITETLRHKDYTNYTPFVVGWGKTMEGGTSANVIHELQIPILPNEECRERYRAQNRLISEDQFDDAVICAGVLAGGKDTCQGDSGGPLMLPEPFRTSVRYYLIGIVSYGIGCARPSIPGVYTSVQYFMDWVTEKVADSR